MHKGKRELKGEDKLNKEQKLKQNRQYIRTYAIYSGIAFEMLVLIGGGAWLGHYLDGKYNTQPLWIIICSIVGISASFLILFKGLLRRGEMERKREEQGKK